MIERLDPETRGPVGEGFSSYPDDDHPLGAVINDILAFLRSRKRARIILYEDAVRAWGVLTPEEAEIVARRLVVDCEKGRYVDPQLGKRTEQLQLKLGLISS